MEISKVNPFGLCRGRNFQISSEIRLDKVDAPVLLENGDTIQKLLPVSRLTGNRQSMYSLLKMVGGEKYSRAIDALLPEIPAIMSDQRLSDDDRVDLLTSRLNVGSASENDRMRKQLALVVDTFKDSFVEVPDASPESSSDSSLESSK